MIHHLRDMYVNEGVQVLCVYVCVCACVVCVHVCVCVCVWVCLCEMINEITDSKPE